MPRSLLRLRHPHRIRYSLTPPLGPQRNNRDRPITAHAIREAQERLILRRDTHIDDLAHKLREERVRRVVEPILTGAAETACSDEDLAYVRDLGLVAQADGGPPRIANPIYAEVVPPARQAASGTGRVAGHDGGHTAGCVRDAAPRAAQGSDAGLGLVDP